MQFTLKRLLVATTLIAIGVGGATLPWRVDAEAFYRLPTIVQGILYTLYFSCGAFVCGGIGCFFKRTPAGFVTGYSLLFLAMLLGAA